MYSPLSTQNRRKSRQFRESSQERVEQESYGKKIIRQPAKLEEPPGLPGSVIRVGRIFEDMHSPCA